MKRNNLEIMAPAGSWESLRSIKAEQPIYYFLVFENLNMRSRSSTNSYQRFKRKLFALAMKQIKNIPHHQYGIYATTFLYFTKIVDVAKEMAFPAIIAADVA
jgi:putative protease